MSRQLLLQLAEIPIPQFYSRAGVGNTANPIFENRLLSRCERRYQPPLESYGSVMFHQTRYRDYQPGATNNDRWEFYVWTYPELDFQLTPNVVLGLAYTVTTA